jgi:hypothetical protein
MKTVKKILVSVWVVSTLMAWPGICLASLIHSCRHPNEVQTCGCPCLIDGTPMPASSPKPVP